MILIYKKKLIHKIMLQILEKKCDVGICVWCEWHVLGAKKIWSLLCFFKSWLYGKGNKEW